MNPIILTGYRCCGKTSVGKELAKRLDWPFVDADVTLEKYQKMTIADYVKERGWRVFRALESSILQSICKTTPPLVLATGGGAVAHNQGEEYRKQNVDMLRKFGTLFYLTPSDDIKESSVVLGLRAIKDPRTQTLRPSLTQEKDIFLETYDILKLRDPLYRQAAHHIIHTEALERNAKDTTEKIKNIVEAIYSIAKEHPHNI